VTSLRRYAAVWRVPGAPMLLVAGIVGRLPIGMTPLALVLLVRGATGSYAAAGAAAAAYGVAAAAAGPVLGRLADRVGPSRVLLATALANPLAVALVLAAVWAGLGAVAVAAAAALLGAVLPPLTAALRSVWADLTDPAGSAADLRGPALALETTAFEVVFVVGPMLVGGVVALASPGAALAVTAVLALAGTACVALGRATRAWRPHPDRGHVRGLGPALAPGMPLLLSVVFGLTFSFGIVGVTIPAFAMARSGAEGETVAGVLLGLWGIGSVAGGVWFGTRQFRAPLPTQWGWTMAAAAVNMTALLFAPSVPVMAALLLVGGLTLAPALIVENALVARIAPLGMVNEAYTWVATIASGGSAAGAAVAGVVLDSRGGTTAAFALGALATGLAALAAGMPGSALRRHEAVAGLAVPGSRG
jgi:predicted MFS family arabinose efflux permease